MHCHVITMHIRTNKQIWKMFLPEQTASWANILSSKMEHIQPRHKSGPTTTSQYAVP